MALMPTVFIVEDDPDVREWLRTVLELAGFIAEPFGSAEEFLRTFTPPCLGCVVADVRAPQMGGIELQARLAQMGQPIPLILVANYADVSTAVRAMKAGAASVVEKPINKHILIESVREAIDKETEQRAHAGQSAEIQARIALLTPRERQILELIIAGQANKEIATNLSLSSKTIETHRAHLMKKLKANSIAELVRMAIASGATRVLQ